MYARFRRGNERKAHSYIILLYNIILKNNIMEPILPVRAAEEETPRGKCSSKLQVQSGGGTTRATKPTTMSCYNYYYYKHLRSIISEKRVGDRVCVC